MPNLRPRRLPKINYETEDNHESTPDTSNDSYSQDEKSEANEFEDEVEVEIESDDGNNSTDDESQASQRFIQDINVDWESQTDSDSDKPVPSKAIRKKGAVRKMITSVALTGLKAKFKDYPFKAGLGWNDKIPPIDTIDGLFRIHVEKTIKHKNFQPMLDYMKRHPIRLATMCSGTECPVIVMDYIRDLLAQLGHHHNFEHIFSAEIEPFKQAYITRNFPDVTLFRDIVEMGYALQKTPTNPATTVYGSKVEIPGEIDILATGFCCVDFSKLNKARKTIFERGESGETLFAIIIYAEKARPKFILFENVLGAPWRDATLKKGAKTRGIDILMKRIGYSVHYIRVDTKEFGIPQTRLRGYMMCVRNDMFGETGPLAGADNTAHDDDPPTAVEILVQEQLKQWAELVETYKMDASVSAETMLKAAMDDTCPALDRTDVLEEEDKLVKWEKCRAGHERFREDLRLGRLRERTHWEESGAKRLPDHWSLNKGATERVKDTLDILYLQNARWGFDDGWMSTMHDLSQNVFRGKNCHPLGRAKCLTPRGFLFSTYEGRKILGQEGWILQGIPQGRVDTGGLSEPQMQDLAGNAMSAPVVSAMLQSLQLIFYQCFTKGDNTYQRLKKSVSPSEFAPSEGYSILTSRPGTYARFLSAHDAVLHAAATAKLCKCEARDEVVSKKFKLCTICHHTACQDHYGNPVHSYQNLRVSRGVPAAFEKILKAALPKKISFANAITFKVILKDLAANYQNRVDTKLWYVEYYLAALKSDLQWKSVKRSDIWEVVYESAAAKLVLQISSRKPQWFLYAKVESTLVGNDPKRVTFASNPIARMSPTGGIYEAGKWQVWLPKQHDIKARLTWSGGFALSWRAALGLVDYAETYVLNKCSVEIPDAARDLFPVDISGDYHLEQNCGHAMNSLHIKKVNGEIIVDDPPVYLFLEHEKGSTGDWDSHPYVFTDETRRIEYGLSRQRFGQLGCGVGQPEFKKVMTAAGDRYQLKRMFRAEEKANTDFDYETLHEGPVELVHENVSILLSGTWVDCPGIGFEQHDESTIQYQQLPAPQILDLSARDCQKSRAIFSCTIEIPEAIATRFAQEEWISIDSKVAREFYYSFLSKFLDGLVIHGYTEDDGEWHQIGDDQNHDCSSCSPKTPRKFWATAPNNKQCAFEEPREAAEYEAALKNRPPAISPVFHIGKGTSAHNRKLTFNVGINPESLSHVARGYLKAYTSTSNLSIKASWRLVTDDGTTSRPVLPPFNLPTTRDMAPASQNLKIMLRPEQLRSVRWQVEQEENPPYFEEEEIVEAGIKQLGSRLFAKATRVVQKRGGLIASQTGFGKTPTTISLVNHREAEDRSYGQTQSTGKIHSAATLVIVPDQLVDQWVSEIEKFSLGKPVVIVIKDMRNLNGKSITELRQANWIVVGMKLLAQETYVQSVAQFASLLQPEKSASKRAKDVWHKMASQNIAKNVEQLMRDPSSINKYLQDQLKIYTKSAEERELPVPSKRLTGAKFVKFSERHDHLPKSSQEPEPEPKKRKPTKKPTKKPSENRYKITKNNYLTMKHAVFEMFSFPRIVLDEAHYFMADHLRVISSIGAHAIWLLTATPNLSSFYDAKVIANMLGIYLGKNDYASMTIDVFKSKIADMTASEKVQALQAPGSPFLLKYRHNVAQKFLNSFARRDDADKTDIEFSEQFVLIHQPNCERITYLELEQMVVPNNFELPAKSYRGHYNLQIADAVHNYKFGPQALMYRASNFNIRQHCLRDHSEYPLPLAISIWGRMSHLATVEGELKFYLKQAVWLLKLDICHGLPHYADFVTRIASNYVGDSDATLLLDQLIRKAESEYVRSDWKIFYCKKGEEPEKGSEKLKYPNGRGKVNGQEVDLAVRYLRDAVNKLNTLATEYVNSLRVLRSAQQVLHIQKLASGDFSELGCNVHQCSLTNAADVTLLSRCGHIVCKKCLVASPNSCPVKGCKSVAVDYERISGAEFTITEPPFISQIDRGFGSKIESVIRTLCKVVAAKEQALLFVQDARSIDNLKYAMDACGIGYDHLENGDKKSSQVLARFQNGESKADVLILNIGESTAAGANLTRANHVLFFSPYWTRLSNGQTKYIAAMEQAMGRAIRWGQKKHVYVYHFLTALTYEVDYFELRNQKIIMTSDVAQPESAIAVDRQAWHPAKTPHSSHTSLLVNID